MPKAVSATRQKMTIWGEARLMRAMPSRVFWARIVAVALVVAGGVDAASTQIALSTGMVYEANPLIRALQGATGVGWIAIKMLAHFGLAGAVLWYPNRATLIAMAAIAALTLAVAVNNTLIYLHIVGATAQG
ncbi:MAG: DUF5658 family protein [Neomegalonema sp.]|nr:DUF5658 family protein [Neomegalonema sp.]